ncbi:hypothetical protein MSAN_01949500 [Mycena sanguinolenta]|uniref:Uncharacterized protein n=1 Tax=Mycena sanguinolenta TaxID=230812 RepID=A0A8H6XNH6_9AGAR|nr:hypothetical protein MSAN_01949500 [Mycena sanguinolenta]
MSLASRSSPPSLKTYTHVILGLVIPGIGLTTVLLTLYGYAAWNTRSRRYLDRVSFRLLTYALVAHFCFGISFPISVLTVYPGRGCAVLSFLSNLTAVFSAGMFFSMAINLPLVLVFSVNGRKMEKYYVGGITLISLVPNLASYASGNLGWDDVNKTCWYHSKDPSATLRWLVGTQSVWILLASLGEVVSFMVILGYLVVYRLMPEDTLSSYASTASHRPGSTILRFRNIILRIGLYPLVSCILNISTTVIGLYLFENHGDPQTNWRLNLTGLAMNAGRPLIYGLFAATDPAFIRALRALRHPDNEPETLSQDRTRGLEMSTIIYLSQRSQDESSIYEREKYNTSGSSREAQMRRYEMSTMVTNPEVGRVHPPANDDGPPASNDLAYHI